MTPRSLSSRLFIGAAVWSAVALIFAGFILSAVYQNSVERSFDERLNVYLKLLVGAMVSADAPVSVDAEAGPPGEPEAGTQAEAQAEAQSQAQAETRAAAAPDAGPQQPDAEPDADDDTATIDLPDPGSLGEPRFELPLSGWYWQVGSDNATGLAMTSGSLLGDALALPSRFGAEPDDTRTWRGYVPGPNDEELRVIEREISFPERGTFRIAVAGNADEVRADVASFRSTVALTLAVMGFGIIVAVIFQVQVGLRPLQRMSNALYAIRTGAADRLHGDFPAEIEPLAEELNALIDSNREVVERARTHVGNLAHALKTPLSVVVNEARREDTPFARKVREQAEQMGVQITRHLERARIAAQRRVIGAVTDVGPVTERLVRAMRRIHEEKTVTLRIDAGKPPAFRGEQQDFEEMLGNLVDNACKWAASEVTVTIAAAARRPGVDRDMMLIHVDDDGPGLTPSEREEAIKRGRRLDETVPGSGLGLSIVTELARLYGGEIRLDAAPAGGLRATLSLPAL
ncbi:ATP-binding protein [Rhodobium gokarnense]|uniref:histidine kinase n=1 Tax=Rhodobium gokarnense TaxID=364296 RepID=A0ABT3HBW4_9HYPH|nr:HAMP domain-containing sensor histidine kinase [Rhodobium gokarnense]MCW2307881.1 signal transduction histidine kinase [Rhodobium gokarnense]